MKDAINKLPKIPAITGRTLIGLIGMAALLFTDWLSIGRDIRAISHGFFTSVFSLEELLPAISRDEPGKAIIIGILFWIVIGVFAVSFLLLFISLFLRCVKIQMIFSCTGFASGALAALLYIFTVIFVFNYNNVNVTLFPLIAFVIPVIMMLSILSYQGYIKQNVRLFLMASPFLVLVTLFAYLPLHGWLYAFFDYRPPHQLFDTEFVGLRWFTELFANPLRVRKVVSVLTNTLAMSGLGLLFSWLPIAFALLLTEIKIGRIKRGVQTLTTLPNYISWVLVYSLAFALFAADGMVNNLLRQLDPDHRAILFLQSNENVWITMWLWNLWKGLGWSAIIYIAAISSVDQELYEAAKVDGAGRFRLMWNITLPGLMSTYMVLLLLSVANFLNVGFEQFYVFRNPFNSDLITILDLYVFDLAFPITGASNYPLSVAVGMLKSLISVTLLFVVNTLSKRVRGDSIV